MKKSDLKVGMKIAMGKRDQHIITLDSYHALRECTVVVKKIGNKVTIEVTARWIIFDAELRGVEGPLETMTFVLSDCRGILGPWDIISKEYNAQVEARQSKQLVAGQVEVELKRLGIKYTLWTNRITILSDSYEVLLTVLKSAP